MTKAKNYVMQEIISIIHEVTDLLYYMKMIRTLTHVTAKRLTRIWRESSIRLLNTSSKLR